MEAFQRELIALLPRMRRFAQSLTRSPSDSEDLVQSAVERALKNWRQGALADRLDSWLFKILQNLWIDEIRRRQRSPTAPAPDENLVGEDGRLTTSSRMDLDAASAAMMSLPADQQTVLALIVIDGMSYQQAADVMDVPIGTIMSRLARARRTLTDKLASPSAFAQDKTE